MIAKELLIYLTHLVLSGRNNEGELEWEGNDKQWSKVQELIEEEL